MIEAMTAWNVRLALPEWILTATSLVALFHDARSPADDKRKTVKWVWFGCLVLGGRCWGVLQFHRAR